MAACRCFLALDSNQAVDGRRCGELLDGGCVYTLGPQPNSTVSRNYLHSQCEKYGVLYHDGGSGWWQTYENVVAASPNAVWLLINSYGIPTNPNNGSFEPHEHGNPWPTSDFQPPNRVYDIFVDNATFFNRATGGNTTMLDCASPHDRGADVNCTATNITVVADGAPWPPAARAIMDAAGPGKTDDIDASTDPQRTAPVEVTVGPVQWGAPPLRVASTAATV